MPWYDPFGPSDDRKRSADARAAYQTDYNPLDAQGRVSGQQQQALQQQQETRSLQMGQIQALQGAANGQGPSAAALQQQQGLGQAVGGANAVAAGMHGASPMARMRAALDSQAQMSGQATQQAAILRAQEQLAARGQLTQALGGARGQDLGLASDLGGQALGYGGHELAKVKLRQDAINAQQGFKQQEEDRDQRYWGALLGAGGQALALGSGGGKK